MHVRISGEIVLKMRIDIDLHVEKKSKKSFFGDVAGRCKIFFFFENILVVHIIHVHLSFPSQILLACTH